MFNVKAKVWLYPGMAGWQFVTIPKKQSKAITQTYGTMKKGGGGSLPVLVTIGKTTWKTSIFPDKKIGAYLLPLKVEVRKKAGVNVGDNVTIILEIRI